MPIQKEAGESFTEQRAIEPEEYAVRKEKLANRWLTPEEGTGQMKAKIIVEDRLNNLPREMKVWMMERQLTTSVEVAQLMQAYRTAREKMERGDSRPNVASDSRGAWPSVTEGSQE